MKRLCRFIPCLVLLFALSLSINAYAKTDEEVIKQVGDAEIMTGTNEGFEGEKTLTRAEVATIVVRMKHMEDEAVSETNYVDVAKDYWAYKYISIATKEGITKGTGADTFSPQRTVTVGEAVTMLIRAIAGQDDINRLEKQSWPNNYMNFARNKKLLAGMSTTKASDEISRIDTARVIANILDAVYGNENEPVKEPGYEEDDGTVVTSKAAAGVIVSIAQLADDYNEVELAGPGKIVELRAHNSELVAGIALPGTYVDFWLAGTRMWDLEAEQKVTDVKEYDHLAKVVKFDDGVVRLVRKQKTDEVVNINSLEYVEANTIIFLKCDEMILSPLDGHLDGDEQLYLREFDDLRLGTEFDIELTEDYKDGLKYSELDGTEVYYQSIQIDGEERIVSMIYAED